MQSGYKITSKLIKLLTVHPSISESLSLVAFLEANLTKRQLLIIMYKLEGYQYSEIAKKLKVSPSTITYEIKKIRRVVKHELFGR